ncbi:MAG: putative Ig domain-containing protein [Legionella sp.]|nr:putative Ig domain-containing protein [Legionella sp.]
MNRTILKRFLSRIVSIFCFLSLFASQPTFAAEPKFLIKSLSPSTIYQLRANQSIIVEYEVTNQTKVTRTLTIAPVAGVNQVVTEGSCGRPFTLGNRQSCRLLVQVNEVDIPIQGSIIGGPVVCKTAGSDPSVPDRTLCSQPNVADRLYVTRATNPMTTDVQPSISTVINTFFQETINVSGGNPPYTFQLIAGSLPSGTSLNQATGVIAGVLTASGTFNYTIQVRDTTGQTVNLALTTTVSALQLTATPSTFTQINIPYSQTNVASNGVAPYTYQLIGGSLPPGLSFNPSTGTVEGTPTAVGPFTYTVQAADIVGNTAQATTTGTINPPLSMTSTPSTYAQVNVAYNQTNAVGGGSAPFNFRVSAGSIPAGTSLNLLDGTVSGTPTTAGAFNYTIEVTDATGSIATGNSSGTIVTALQLTATPSQYTQVNVAYSQTNTAAGGSPPYSYRVQSGSVLPAGLTLQANGTVSGTPQNPGAFSYTIEVVDQTQTPVPATTSGTMIGALQLIATPSTYTQAGAVYSQANTASGGTPPYTFQMQTGSILPAGLTLQSNGTVSGTPQNAGPFSYTVEVVDQTLTVVPATTSGTMITALQLTPTPSQYTQVNVAYSQANTASGGTPPYTYRVAQGSVLPNGLNLLTDGTVSGTPTTAGSFNYTIEVVDQTLTAVPATTTGTMIAALELTATPSPFTQVGAAYNQVNTASGGTPPYTFQLEQGSVLPNGLTLLTDGRVTGTPQDVGAFSYTIEVVDQTLTAVPATTTGTMTVGLELTATPSALAEVSVPYSQANTASGGTPPYTFRIQAGSTLPLGLNLNVTTGEVFGTPQNPGAFNYTIEVVDQTGTPAPATSTGTINALPQLTATPSQYKQVNIAYSQVNTVSGGTPPYYYDLSAGAFPAGTDIDHATGVVSGTPTTSGSFNYTVRVTDHATRTAIAASSGTINMVPQLTATPSTYTQVNVVYSQTNTVSGGTAPYTYRMQSGSVLPAGLTLGSTGTVSGIPENAAPFNYTVEVVDATLTVASATSSGTINAALALTKTASIDAQVAVPYSQANVASGGTGNYTFRVSAGTLPAGLDLDLTNGTVFGTPQVAGPFNYTIEVTDGTPLPATQNSQGTINAALSMNASVPVAASLVVGNSYTQTNTPVGGTAPYTYTLISGAVPSGTTFNTSNGTVQGTLTTAQSFSYTVRINDVTPAAPVTATTSGTIYTPLTITAQPPVVSGINIPYSQTNTAAGGKTPYTYSVGSGTLPTGTTLNASTGTVSGTPTATGTFTYTIRVTDSNTNTADVQTTTTVQSSYTVGGSIYGLTAGQVILLNNGANALTVNTGASTFQFTIPVTSAQGYNVTIGTQPATLVCSVTNGTGTNVTANVTTVIVTCAGTSYTIGGTVSGLSSTGLSLQNNGTNTTPIAAGATSFTFSQPVAAGSSYNVTAASQPTTPVAQTCTVNNGSGTNVQSNITSVSVVCNNNAYSVGGSITGLTASGLVLQNNLTDNLSVAANATSFTFPTNIAQGSAYSVTVKTQPAGLQCSVTNGSGTMGSSPVTNVAVSCVPVFAYVINAGNGTLSIASVNGNTGALGTPSTSGASFNDPRSIVINPKATFGYVTNNDTGTISLCTINSSTGAASCPTTTGGSGFGLIVGVTLDPAATHLYATTSTATTAWLCNVNQTDGTLSGCTTTGSGFASPAGIVIHPSGNFAYVSNSTDSTVSLCMINNKTTGVFSGCANTGITFSAPRRLALNPAGTILYTSQAGGNNNIRYCSVNVNTGALSNCAVSGSNLTTPLGIVVNTTGTFLYAANNGSTTVTACGIDQGTGALTTCTPYPTYDAPTGIALTGR